MSVFPRRPALLRSGILCAACNVLLASSTVAGTVPLDDFVRLQSATRTVVTQVARSIVAIEQAAPPGVGPKHHMPYASGVIISPDGLILSQYHVTHMLDPTNSAKSRKPGARVTVILSDGQKLDAKLLGADLSFDLSLLRLSGPGPFPYCSPADEAEVTQGSYVLKFGHPLGYRIGRGAVVRIGRVLCQQDDTFISDCHLNGGDSGGPLFDLSGRLVGIVRSGPNHPLRPSARSGMLFACTTIGAIRPRLETMQRGEITGPNQKVIADSITRFQRAPSLPLEKWTQGTMVRGELATIVAQSRKSVVAIKDGEEIVALGTIVHSDGWVITKASELPKIPNCQFDTLKSLSAKVAGINAEYDLALLKLPTTNLPAITWSEEPVDLEVGTIVVAPGFDNEPIAWGIVSVATRDLEGPFPTVIVPAPRARAQAGPSELTGIRVEEGYRVETVSGDLVGAGIQAGDILLTVDGIKIQSDDDLIRYLNRHLRWEPIRARLLRGGGSSETDVRLTGRRSFRYSFRADDFPNVFEHDAPLTASECGGPIVGLDGKAMGITIASVSAHGCMAIPAKQVQALVEKLISSAATER